MACGDSPGLATLAALLTLAPFDAVLGLPSGLVAAALLLGAASSGAPRTGPALGVGWWLLTGALLVGASAAAGLRLAAFVVAHHPAAPRADRELAVRLAPDDLEARLALTGAYVLEGRCADARPHLDWLAAHLHRWPRVEEWIAACPR